MSRRATDDHRRSSALHGLSIPGRDAGASAAGEPIRKSFEIKPGHSKGIANGFFSRGNLQDTLSMKPNVNRLVSASSKEGPWRPSQSNIFNTSTFESLAVTAPPRSSPPSQRRASRALRKNTHTSNKPGVQEALFVEDESEDMGNPVASTSQAPDNLGPSQSKRRSELQRFVVEDESITSNPTVEMPLLYPDSDSTARMKRRRVHGPENAIEVVDETENLASTSHLSKPRRSISRSRTSEEEGHRGASPAHISVTSESISDFSDDEPPAGKQKSSPKARRSTPSYRAIPKNIRARVQTLEEMRNEQVPHVDLKKIQKKNQPTITGSMRGKSDSQGLKASRPRDPQKEPKPANSESIKLTKRAGSPSKSRAGSAHVYMPIKTFIVQHVVYESSKDGKTYWFYWDPATSQAKILDGQPLEGANTLHSWIISRDFHEFQFSTEYAYPMFSFEPKGTASAEINRALISGAQGDVVIEFDGKHPSTNSLYEKAREEIGNKLKSLTGKSVSGVSAVGARKCFEMATAAADLYTKSLEEQEVQNLSHKPFEPVEDIPSRSRTRKNSKKLTLDGVSTPFPRRSGRYLETSRTEVSPPADLDELILMYPLSGTGAVNISKMDRSRLKEGEFLNDNLIEFGFKWWLNDLRDNDPTLADQVHVLSSFFYKKLSSAKTIEEGYASVRKWTSKIDLFQKKYIIVPINEHLHWYLAIIYQPEHVLVPPQLKAEREVVPKTRNQKRQSHASSAPTPSTSAILTSTTLASETGRQLTLSPTPDPNIPAREVSEVAEGREVEKLLRTCSLTEDAFRDPSPALSQSGTATGGPVPIEVDEDGATSATLRSNDNEDDDIHLEIPHSGLDADVMDVDPPSGEIEAQPIENTLSITPTEPATSIYTPTVDAPIPSVIQVGFSRSRSSNNGTVETASFYGAGSSNMTRAKDPSGLSKEADLESDTLDVDQDDEVAIDVTSDEQPRTYIFTLDSLGSRHSKASKVLNMYLRLEAVDKKGLKFEETSDTIYKQASVPTQPNFCDCGVYLLHFARTFMKAPQKYRDLSLRTGKKVDAKQREADWEGATVSSLRSELGQLIDHLSEKWKAERDRKRRESEASAPSNKPASTVGGPSDAVVETGNAVLASGEDEAPPPPLVAQESESEDDVVITDHIMAPKAAPRPRPRPVKKGRQSTAKGKDKAKQTPDEEDEILLTSSVSGSTAKTAANRLR